MKLLSSCLAGIVLTFGADVQAQNNPPDNSVEISKTRELDLPAGGGAMTIPSDWHVLGEGDPTTVYLSNTQELKEQERGVEELTQTVQVMKYPLSQRGANPFVTVTWMDDEAVEDSEGAINYLHSNRIPFIRDFYGEISIKSAPQKVGGGAGWSFEAKLPEKVADWSGWSGEDYVREYIIPGKGGFWIVTGTHPKEGAGGVVDGSEEVDSILQSIANLGEVVLD